MVDFIPPKTTSEKTVEPTKPQPNQWLTGLILQHGAEIGHRFAYYYQELSRLPRRTRRFLQKKTAVTLAHLALILALTNAPLYANNINVETTAPGINTGDGLCSLTEAIHNAQDLNTGQPYSDCAMGDPVGPDTVILSGNTYTLTASDNDLYGDTGLPVISDTVTIQGAGATIRRDGAAADFRILAVNPTGDLTLDGVTITGGRAIDGGGIFSYEGSVTITNTSTISGNVATNSGGGIYNYADGGSATVRIYNSHIVSNTATNDHGGGIYNKVRDNQAVVIVDNSTIENNTTNDRGGGIYNNALGGLFDDAQVIIRNNSRISGNTTNQSDGGGIYNSADLGSGLITIQDSIISGNRAGANSSSGDDGGGLYNYGYYSAYVTVDNSAIVSNTVNKSGGGIYNYAFYQANVTIQNNTIISGNQTVGTEFGSGGGIFNKGDSAYAPVSIYVYNSQIINNNIWNSGGGLFNEDYTGYATTLVQNSTIAGNRALNADFPGSVGGGIMNPGGTVTIDNSRISGNQADFGGGIASRAGYDIIDGGGELIDGKTTRPRPNQRTPAAPQEAIVFIQNSSIITGNTAAVAGGGILQQSFVQQATLTVNNSTIANNNANYGGGIANNSVISGYSAVVNLINNALVTGNQANYGAGIEQSTYASSVALTIDNSTISDNQASGDGGGIISSGSAITSSIQINIQNNSIITGNIAHNGGGIASFVGAGQLTLQLRDSTVSYNYAYGDGGGLRTSVYQITGTAAVTITSSLISGNTALDEGGGIVNEAYSGISRLTINSSTLNNNYAFAYGGGLSNLATNNGSTAVATLNNSTISGNTVISAAAGINNYAYYDLATATLTLNNSTLTGNTALDGFSFGGGIINTHNTFYTSAVTLTLNRSLISGNNAAVGTEVYNGPGNTTVNSNNYNLFGYSGYAGTVGFAYGANDETTARPLNEIVDTTLANNGGSTPTHALVSTSPAIDLAPQTGCTIAPLNGVDQRGESRDDWRCDAGAFELKLTDSTSVTQDIDGLSTFTFGPTLGIVDVINDGACLSTITINQVSSNHPQATSGLQTGRYWQISQTGCTISDTFSVNLTLPATTPDANDKVCRYTGTGQVWDCDADSFDNINNTVTRNGVDAFSDWAIGNNVGPTAVSFQDFAAQETQNGRVGLFSALILTMSSLWAAWQSRRRRHN